jgi:hypothetical protein
LGQREITLRIVIVPEVLGWWKTAPKVVDAPKAPIAEAVERWTRITLSYVRHTNNCKY